MPIKDIRQFIDWVKMGDESLHARQQVFLERKQVVEAKMAELQEMLDLINHKCWYYETAIEAGTEKIHLESVPKGKLPCEVLKSKKSSK
jgi:DNA-binding transcriptional MerR regulator